MSPTNGRARGCSRCSLPTTSYAGWWRSLGKGRYTPARVFQLVIDLLVLLAMLGLMVSGVMLSNHVFALLPISGGMSFARLLHMASAYWGFVLMSLHWNMVLGMMMGSAISVFGKSRIHAAVGALGAGAAFMITGPATKITNLGALKIVLGVRHFAAYISFVMAFSLVTGLVVNLFS